MQTKKIHEPEILDPIEYLASKFRTQNNTKLEYCYLNMGLFNQTYSSNAGFCINNLIIENNFFLDHTKKFTKLIFSRPKKIHGIDRSFDPPKVCQTPTSPSPHHVYCEYLPE